MSPDPSNHGNGRVEALEGRVGRLEDAVAALTDTRQLEDRLVERLSQRLNRSPALTAGEPAGAMIEARRHRLPPARATAVAEPAPPAAPQTWLLVDAYHEARSMIRMFMDPRYRVSRGMLPLTIGLLAAIGTSGTWVPFATVPFVGDPLSRIVALILAFVLFKVLSREARRYRTVFPDPSPPPPA
jgi:hypothetical protein